MIFILAGELFGTHWSGQNCRVSGITCDSRRIKPGYVFVCLSGERDNGYRYIKEAETRGAVAIIADRYVDSEIPVILCCNPRRKMAEYAKKIYSLPDEKMFMIGVTGTNGKTTVAHLLRDIFIKDSRKTAMIGTNGCYFNNYLTDESFTTSTTPESCELFGILKNMFEFGATDAIMEVSSHAMSLDRVFGINFDVSVFTNLTQDHLDYHKNMEAYFIEKEKLFKVSDRCVINTDDEYGKRLYEKYSKKAVSVGFNNQDIFASDVVYNANGAEFYVNDGDKYRVNLHIPGRFSVYNALCAYGAAKVRGISSHIICDALGETKGVKGRAETVDLDCDFKAVIDYAHSPDSLQNIIKSLREVSKGRIITLFGCGGNRDKGKRYEMGKVSGELSDFTVITSDNPRCENPVKILKDIEKGIIDVTDKYTVIPNRFDAIGYAVKMAEKDDIILLAGKGHEDYIIENDKKIHFDEREVLKYWTQNERTEYNG